MNILSSWVKHNICLPLAVCIFTGLVRLVRCQNKLLQNKIIQIQYKRYTLWLCRLRQIHSSMQHLYTAALLCFALTRFILRLATFSLERLRCCTLIGGSRAAPCVAGKTISGITVPSAQWADLVSCWCISLVLGLPSFFFSAYSAGSLKTQKGVAALPASKLNVDVNAQGHQVPPADMHLYSIIGACQWG